MTVIAITGGGRGIGAATAHKLAARGDTVVIGDIDGAATAEVPGVLSLTLDVTDAASYQRFLDDVHTRFGALDVLVANAGVMWVGAFDKEPETAMRRQIAVNLEGVITGFKLATPAMRQRRSGHVVVVATDLAAGTSSGRVALLTPEQVAAGVVALIDSRRPELFLPRKAGLAAKALAVAPARMRAVLHRFLVPDQVLLGQPEQRRAYQSRTLDTPDP